MTSSVEHPEPIIPTQPSITAEPSDDVIAPPPLTPEDKQKAQWYLGGLVLLFVAIMGFGLYWQNLHPTGQISTQSPPTPSSASIPQEKREKMVGIIASMNTVDIEVVTRAVATDFIPDSQAPLENGYASYTFPAWQLDLSEAELQKLLQVLPADHRPEAYANGLNLTTSQWEVFDNRDDAYYWTKDGYACLVSTGSNGICPPKEKQCPVLPKFVQCAQLAHPEENTKEVVVSFMDTVLSQAKISCAVAKSCTYKSTQMGQVPLYQHSRQIIYVEPIGEATIDELSTMAEAAVREVRALFTQANWQTRFEDYTKTEQGWSPNTMLSWRVLADNDRHHCVHTITFTRETSAEGISMRKMVECQVLPQIIGAEQGVHE